MNDSSTDPAADSALDFLRAGAAQTEALGHLRASGALGRWQASQAAYANYHAPHVTRTPVFWGDTMEVDIRETVSSEIFIHGVFEPELSAFLYRFLQAGRRFVDIGAHYGYFSLLAAHRVGPGGRVAAIEPCERTSWRLYHNTKDHPQVSLHRVAAWEREETLTLNDYGPLFSAFNSIGERRIHESAEPVKATPFEVRAVALDQYLHEIDLVPDVIKIDAESAEIQVLRGLTQTLRDHRPLLTIEVGDYAHLLEKGLPSSADVLRAVAGHGYTCFRPTLDGVEHHEILTGGLYEYGNIVAVPTERAADFQNAASW